jgi:protein-S-isoprenylcysteine O-methyltransferase Ste14
MRATIKHEGKAGIAILSVEAIVMVSGFVLYVFFPHVIPWAQLTPWAVAVYSFIPELAVMLFWVRWCGVVLGFVSLPFLVWVQHSLGRQFAPTLELQEEHVLVTSGPYRRVRHPMYTVHIFLFLSWWLVSDNWFFLVNYFLTLALIGVRMPKEEAMLLKQFGDEYRSYMQRSGQLWPRLRSPRVGIPPPGEQPALDRYGANSIAKEFSIVVIITGLLFLVAGRFDYWNAWFYLLWSLVFVLCFVLAMVNQNPGLLNKRGQRGGALTSPETPRYDKIFFVFFTPLMLVIPAVSAFDAGRLLWSSLPLLWVLTGFLLMIIGQSIFGWAMVSNKHFEATVRIQWDRAHTTVTSGPYRYVRHPGYLGQILLYLGMPLALGSVWGLIPGVLMAAVFIGRTAKEDATLRKDLKGYQEYTEQVRKRLIPFIW